MIKQIKDILEFIGINIKLFIKIFFYKFLYFNFILFLLGILSLSFIKSIGYLESLLLILFMFIVIHILARKLVLNRMDFEFGLKYLSFYLKEEVETKELMNLYSKNYNYFYKLLKFNPKTGFNKLILNLAIINSIKEIKISKNDKSFLGKLNISFMLYQSIFIAFLLIPYISLSLLITIGVSIELKLLIVLIGIIFVYFLNISILEPILNLVMVKKIWEHFE